MHESILAIGVLIFTAHLFASLFKFTRIPDVLLLMIVGICIGPVFGWVNEDFFGSFGLVITTIALIIILFDGGMHLSVDALKKSFKHTLVLSLLTFVFTLAFVAAISHYVFGLNLVMSLLTGSMLAPISPAVVLPMISALKLDEKAKTILTLETAITDVLAIILVFSLAKSAQSGEIELGKIVQQLSLSTLVALIIGLFGGLIWSQLLGRIRQFPNTVFTTFAAIFILYGIAELFHFSGALTALAFGFAISNLSTIDFTQHKLLAKLSKKIELNDFEDNEHSFFAEIQFLLKIFFFVYLGISFPIDEYRFLIWGFGISLAIILIRFLIARFSLAKDIQSKSASIMAIMIPKGLASAVLASIPAQYGLDHADLIQNLVDAVILWTILLTSIQVILVEKSNYGNHMIKLIGFREKQLNEDLENDPLIDALKDENTES